MTLVTLLQNPDGIPAFLSDLLVTSDWSTPMKRYPTMPVRVEEGGGLPIRYNVAGLYPKVAIINRNLAIGVAGNGDRCPRLIQYFRENMRSDIFNEQQLTKCLEDYEFLQGGWPFSDGLIACAHYDQGACGVLARNFRVIELGHGRRFVSIGTGTGDLEKYLSRLGAGEISRITSEAVSSTTTALCMFAHTAIDAQKQSGYGLNHLWGGGFECTFLTPGGFEKLDRVLYQKLYSDEHEGNIRVQPMYTWLQQYKDGEIYIRFNYGHVYDNHFVTYGAVPKYMDEYDWPEAVRPEHTFTLIEHRSARHRLNIGFAQYHDGGNPKFDLLKRDSSDLLQFDLDFTRRVVARGLRKGSTMAVDELALRDADRRRLSVQAAGDAIYLHGR